MLFMRTSDGLDIQYKEIGRGPTIVFSHEFGGSHASWERQIERLSTAHRCIIYTARGFSPSTVSDKAIHYGRQSLVRDLIELVAYLKLDRFHLVGSSMGAVTTLLAAELLGDKVKSITLVGCSAGPLSQLDLFEHRSGIRQLLRAVEENDPRPVSATLGKQRPYARLIREKAALWNKYRSIMDQHEAVGLALTLQLVEWEPSDFKHMEQRLQRVRVPTLLVVGDEDHPAAHSTTAHLARILPSARMVELPDCGRLAHIEQPAVFNKLLWQHVRNFELRDNGQRHYSKLELSLNVENS
jgi:pimeloyl-ACP methyl ester carboxylesterase